MFLLDYFFDFLTLIGFRNKSAKLLFLGLDNAGKTTLLHMLKNDRLAQPQPTYHPTKEELIIDKVKFTTFDLGGHKEARRAWVDYLLEVDAIVFIIDGSDPGRFYESKVELDNLIAMQLPPKVPFLIFVNKIDKPMAVSEAEVRQCFGLMQTAGKDPQAAKNLPPDVRAIELFMCSFVNKMGYKDGFIWLSKLI